MVRNIGNRAGSWRFATSLLVLTIVLLIASPIATIAQGEGLATSETTSEAQAPEPAEQVVPVVEQPTAVPVQPTAVPPTAVPPTAVPPTAVPPTIVPPTEVPPTAVPTQQPTAVPTEQVWVNTDALRVTDSVTAYTVQQGASATVSITYNVTTPRSSTTIYARLSGAADGWTISSPQRPDTDPAAMTAAWTEAATLQPGTAFILPIVITAPATVAQDHAVSLHLWSVAAGEKGQETGVARTDLRIATITALAPPPAPTPTVEPTAVPTNEPTAVPTSEGQGSETQATPDMPLDSDSDSGNIDDESHSATPTASRATSESSRSMLMGEKSCTQVSEAGDPLEYECSVNSSGTYSMKLLASSGFQECYAVKDGQVKNCPTVINEVVSGIGNNGNKDNRSVFIRIKTESELYLKFELISSGGSSSGVYVIGEASSETPTRDNLELICDPDVVNLSRNAVNSVTCTVSAKDGMPSGVQVNISKVQFSVPQGVDLSWDGETATENPYTVNPQNAIVSAEPKQSYEFTFSLEQMACSITETEIEIKTWFTYNGEQWEGPTTSPDVTGETVFHPLSVALSGTVNFGTMTWDGERYVSLNGDGTPSDSSAGSTTLIVSRHGDCGSPNPEKIQITTTASTKQPGLVPEYEGASIPQGAAISSLDGAQLEVDPGFSGDASVGLDFTLTPPEDAEPDEYSDMWVHVTVVNAN